MSERLVGVGGVDFLPAVNCVALQHRSTIDSPHAVVEEVEAFETKVSEDINRIQADLELLLEHNTHVMLADK